MIGTQLLLVTPFVVVGVFLRFFKAPRLLIAIIIAALWFGGFLLSSIAGAAAAMGGGMSGGYEPLSAEAWWGFWLMSFFIGLFLAFAYSRRSFVVTSLLAVLSLSILALASWLPSSEMALNYAEDNPEWAWLHGGPEMQQVSGPLLLNKLVPGAPMSEAVQMLERYRHPKQPPRLYLEHRVALFYVQKTRYGGIRLEYKDGKILKSSFFRTFTELAEQGGAGQPATAPQSKSQDNKNTKPESNGRSQ